MVREIDVEAFILSIQEPGIKSRTSYYCENNITTAEIRPIENNRYELWITAKVSNMGTRYLENYARVDLTKEQLIQLRDLIDRKLKE